MLNEHDHLIAWIVRTNISRIFVLMGCIFCLSACCSRFESRNDIQLPAHGLMAEHKLKLANDAVSVAASPDGKLLAVGINEGHIEIVDSNSMKIIQRLE